MNKLFITLIGVLLMNIQAMAQNVTTGEILDVVRRTNDYFMKKYDDPTKDTFVKKVRTSNLWTRAVYYEGLMALYEIDPQQRYIDYTDTWADHHKWTARHGVKATDADDQCCQHPMKPALPKCSLSRAMPSSNIELRRLLLWA